MMIRRSFAIGLALSLGVALLAQSQEDDHEPLIRGLKIGMTAQEVLDLLGKMPDGRKDEKEIIVYWKLENGDVLQVNFWKEHVNHLGIQYKNLRPVADLWLIPLMDQRSSLDSRDPRARYEYKAAETDDKMRVVWSKPAAVSNDFRVEVRFLSGSRQKFGGRREQYIEFKYVTVRKEDLKKFEKAFANESGVRD